MSLGPEQTFLELKTGASLGSIRVLNELLEVALRALAVDEALRHDLALGVAELVANVCEHEYSDASPGEVSLRLEASAASLRLAVTSQGPPFDLDAAMAMASERDPLDALLGSGLGLPLLRGLFDTIDHSWEEGRGNRITLVKTR